MEYLNNIHENSIIIPFSCLHELSKGEFDVDYIFSEKVSKYLGKKLKIDIFPPLYFGYENCMQSITFDKKFNETLIKNLIMKLKKIKKNIIFINFHKKNNIFKDLILHEGCFWFEPLIYFQNLTDLEKSYLMKVYIHRIKRKYIILLKGKIKFNSYKDLISRINIVITSNFNNELRIIRNNT